MADEMQVSQVLAQVEYDEAAAILVSQVLAQVEYEEAAGTTVQPSICIMT